MLSEEIIDLADELGLDIEKKERGFSVQKNSKQIKFFFNEQELLTYLTSQLGKASPPQDTSNSETNQKLEEPQSVKIVERTVVEVRDVAITDFNMPFMSMVLFMIKWSIASIPAMLISAVMFYVIFGLLGAI